MQSSIMKNNFSTVIKRLLCYKGVSHYNNVIKLAKAHPCYPSFTSIKFAFEKIGINSLGLNTSFDILKDELPKPLLAHICTNADIYLPISKVDENDIYIISGNKSKEETMSVDLFLKSWAGNVLIFDWENIQQKRRSFNFRRVFSMKNWLWSFVMSVTILFIFSLFLSAHPVISYIFIAVSLFGLVPSGLLVLDKISDSGSGVRKICNINAEGGEQCTAIFGKKGTKFLDSIDWSDIGFAYFIFIIIINLFGPDELGVSVTILSSLFSLIYVLYSLYFQFYIAKSWCKLCLGVQVCLALMAVFSTFNVDKLNIDMYNDIPNLLFLFVIFTAIISSVILIISSIEKNYHYSDEVNSFYRLKHLPSVVNVLYQQNPKIENITDIGVFYNKECVEQITIIISPICKECIQLLMGLMPMIKEKKKVGINIVIISDYKSENQEQYNLALCLIEKYILKTCDYLDFLYQYALSYPVSKNKLLRNNTYIKDAEVILNENIEWCKKNLMFNVPALFLNGKYLPNVYSILDIDYFTE